VNSRRITALTAPVTTGPPANIELRAAVLAPRHACFSIKKKEEKKEDFFEPCKKKYPSYKS
jgi:hypothetical protein